MKEKSNKVHIHKVVQARLEERGLTHGGVFPEYYDKVRELYNVDEKGMIDQSELRSCR